ncbi:MAG: transglutaminase domain-containing protein, partial [Candidatus Mucispirillum faecigallinarum]|nr:transglutaminase domain-containing protein [Candidatus Mucispirillum faecigallinarum]
NMTAARTLYNTQSALIEEGAQNILSKLKDDMNEGQKFRVLHDEFLKTVSYGQQGAGVRDIRGGLGPNKKVLCEGYARTLTYLCQRAGLEVIYVVGTANYSGTGDDGSGGAFDHAWIKVKIDGQWYNVDPTNNDSVVANSPTVLYNHFLMSDAEYDKDHTAGKTTNEVSPNTSYGTFPASAAVSYNKEDTEYP